MAINKKDIGKTGSIRYSNTSSDEIQITEDKLRLKLKDYIEKARESKDWVSWLGIFVSTMLSLLTAEFHDCWIMSKSFLFHTCSLVCLGSLILTVYHFKKAWKCDLTIDSFISSCKNVE